MAEQSERGKSPAARGRGLMKAVWAALTLVAVITELRKPKDERTWRGTVLGFVPYDLRFPPTWARFRTSLWSPDDPRFLMPRAFGVGWTPNLGRIVALVSRRV